MCRPSIPPDDVARSLGETVRFAKSVLPLLRVACDHVKSEIGQMPHGAARHDNAERQIAPALIRLRMHQLIQGHNYRCLKSGGAMLGTHRIRNGAVCLLQAGLDYRMLKESKRYPTRPSGIYQEGLINQNRYWNLVKDDQDGLFTAQEQPKPLLEGLIYYIYANGELRSAYVVIPDGFTADSRVNVADSQPVELYDLDQLATFEQTGFIDTRAAGESLLLSDGALEDDVVQDPYSESGLLDYDVSDELPESSVESDSVLNEKEPGASND